MALLQVRDYRLTTAEILYHLPDHPAILQSYVWQGMDLAPDFPSLRKFLDFWRANLEGKLHSIRMASGKSVARAELRHANHVRHLH